MARLTLLRDTHRLETCKERSLSEVVEEGRQGVTCEGGGMMGRRSGDTHPVCSNDGVAKMAFVSVCIRIANGCCLGMNYCVQCIFFTSCLMLRSIIR